MTRRIPTWFLTVGSWMCMASVAHASGGAAPTADSLHVNFWAWDDHAPPVGWFFLNFVLFLWLLVRFTKKPLAKAFRERHDAIRKSLVEAQGAHASALAKHQELQSKLDGVDEQVATIVEQSRAEGDEERRRIVEDARRAAEQLRNAGARMVAQEELRVKGRLQAGAAAAMLAQATELLNQELNQSDKSRLLDDAIADLVNGSAMRGAA